MLQLIQEVREWLLEDPMDFIINMVGISMVGLVFYFFILIFS